MVEVMEIMATSLKRSHALSRSVLPTLHQATADPCLCQRLLDTHWQVWVSLLLGHCSLLLGPGVYKLLFVPSKSLFPQSCVSSGSSTVGLMATSSKRAFAIPSSAAPRTPAPVAGHFRRQTLKGRSGSASMGSPGCTRFCLSLPSVSGGYGI